VQDDNHRRPDGDRATMQTICAALGATALIAAIASYLHALDVVEAADGHTLVAHCIPALADLTIFASSANILDAYRHGERGKRFPWLSVASLVISVLVTLGANWAAGDPAQVPTWLVNVWPPVAFMLALESLFGYTRRRALRSAKRTTEQGIPCPHDIGMNRDDAVRAAYEHARDCEGSPLTFTALGTAFGMDRKTARELVTTSPRPGPAQDPPPAASAPAGLPSMNGGGTHG
jgi:Protein of unknown function (DUF2637)